jgi:hypothetical protein
MEPRLLMLAVTRGYFYNNEADWGTRVLYLELIDSVRPPDPRAMYKAPLFVIARVAGITPPFDYQIVIRALGGEPAVIPGRCEEPSAPVVTITKGFDVLLDRPALYEIALLINGIELGWTPFVIEDPAARN